MHRHQHVGAAIVRQQVVSLESVHGGREESLAISHGVVIGFALTGSRSLQQAAVEDEDEDEDEDENP